MATKSSSSPSWTSTSSEAIVLSSEVSTTTTASPASSTTTSASETSVETKLAFGLRLSGETSAMSPSYSKSRGAESLRLLAKVIETWGEGSKLSHLVTVGLALVLLQT